MPTRHARKLLIIGWDAADWKIIDPLLAMGRMPNLRRLIDAGVRGDLRSLDPMLSPLLWTTIATGKTADKHGILNFIEPDESGSALRPITCLGRKTKALWNILTQAGLSTSVVGWYATHPAEPIKGAIISNLVQESMPAKPDESWPIPAGAVHPEPIAGEIDALRLHPMEIDPRELLSLLPHLPTMPSSDRRIGLLRKLIAQGASINNMATWLLREGTPAGRSDCAMIFFETIDVVGHHFMQYHPPRMPHVSEQDFEHYKHVMFGVYQFHDLMLGSLLDAAGPDTTVILLSDHGFHSDHLRPEVQPSIDDAHAAMDATWHRPLGVLVMSGPGLKRGQTIHGATLLDIAPTALTLLGQPIGADMDGRVLTEAFEHPPEVDRVFSWDTLEGDAGQHPPDKRVDGFDAHETMKQLADLGYIADVSGEVKAQMERLRHECRFNLGVVHMSAKRYDQALEQFEPLARECPDEIRYAMNHAHCLQQLGRWSDARLALDAIVARWPEVPAAKLALAAALTSDRKFKEAADLLESLPAGVLSTIEHWLFVGGVHWALRHSDRAEHWFRKALSQDPKEPRGHHGLAQVALVRGDYAAAVEHALDAVDIQHSFPEAYYTIGCALTWQRDYQRAIQAFNICVSMQPGHIDAHRYLASIHRQLGNRHDAPKHRQIAEDLMARRDKNMPFQQGFMAEAPAGPLEWERSVGQSS